VDNVDLRLPSSALITIKRTLVCDVLPEVVHKLFLVDILSKSRVSWDNHDVYAHSFFVFVFSHHRCMGSQLERIYNRPGDSIKEINL